MSNHIFNSVIGMSHLCDALTYQKQFKKISDNEKFHNIEKKGKTRKGHRDRFMSMYVSRRGMA